jgi:hypothetical protein
MDMPPRWLFPTTDVANRPDIIVHEFCHFSVKKRSVRTNAGLACLPAFRVRERPLLFDRMGSR